MTTDQIARVAEISGLIQGIAKNIEPTADGRVPVTIFVPRGAADMPVVFGRILKALNTQVPSVMNATEGEVFSK